MGLLTRREDWPLRLAEAVESARHRAYRLGEWDCLRWPCLAVLAMTDVDFWPSFAGYRTELGAARRIRALGASYPDAVTATLGVSPAPTRVARRGDLVMYRNLLGQDCLGVCLGARVAVVAPAGLLQIPLMDAGMGDSWRVG